MHFIYLVDRKWEKEEKETCSSVSPLVRHPPEMTGPGLAPCNVHPQIRVHHHLAPFFLKDLKSSMYDRETAFNLCLGPYAPKSTQYTNSQAILLKKGPSKIAHLVKYLCFLVWAQLGVPAFHKRSAMALWETSVPWCLTTALEKLWQWNHAHGLDLAIPIKWKMARGAMALMVSCSAQGLDSVLSHYIEKLF